MSHLIPVKTQRAAFGYLMAILMTAFSTAVLWRHFDNVFGSIGVYLIAARVGTSFIGLTVLFLTGWHIYFKNELARRVCLAGALILSAVDLLHACNILAAMDAESAQARSVKLKTESVAAIAGKVAESTARANADAARQANAAGQHKLASQLARKGNGVDAKGLIDQVVKETPAEAQAGFLPDWYVKKYSFFVLLACGLFVGAMAMVVTALEDKDGNGIPDIFERGESTPQTTPAPLKVVNGGPGK